MEIIADTSVIIAVILNEPEKTRIIGLTVGYDIIAPMSLKWEVGNAFSAMLKRKRIHIDSAVRAVKSFDNLPVKYVDIDMENALMIACKQNIYAYDAYFIQCAVQYKKSLITLDKHLISCAKVYQIDIIEVYQ